MKYKNILQSISILFLSLCLVACSNSSKDGNVNEEPPTVVIQSLSNAEAIQTVQYHISQTKKMVLVQTSYNETVTKKKPCTQYDIDVGRDCFGVAAGAPYGYRNVTESVRKCCRQRQKALYTIKGEWVASYSKSNDNWSIELEFSDDSKAKRNLTWLVSDKSKKVTEENDLAQNPKRGFE